MNNKEINFDYKWYFRIFDNLRVILKSILTKLRLRNNQSCKYCGRDQSIVWICEDELWNKLQKKWRNKTLCLECFISIFPEKLNISDIKIFGYAKLS